MGGVPWLKRRWDHLLWVPDANEPEATQARGFLASVFAILIPLVMLMGMGVLPLWLKPAAPAGTVTFRAAIGLVVVMVACLLLNRRGYHEQAIWIFVVAATAALAWVATERLDLLHFMTALILLEAALLPLRLALTLGLLQVVVAHAVVFEATPATVHQLLLPFSVSLFFLPLVGVVQAHHQKLEQRRLDDLRGRERWFSTTLSSIGDAVLTADPAGVVTFLNPVAEVLTGWKSEEARGLPVERVFQILNEDTGEPAETPVQDVLKNGTVVGLANHTLLVARDGVRRPIADSAAPIADGRGNTFGVVLVFRDMSDERTLQARVEHSQRLDALGHLAGGVAHDFNNLLTAIGGGTQLALDELPPDGPVRTELEEVLSATRRAVALTSQLLAFSRRQVMQAKPVAINDAVAAAVRMLRRVLAEGIRIVTQFESDAGWVLVDPVRLEQVLVNLAINAGDAMPGGGTLTLSTARVALPEGREAPALPAGSYARISVADTGSGIDQRVLPHIFEPFFTTKPRDRGTGLGLSTVYGIVQQSGGAVLVESKPSEGAAFQILLPSVDGPERRPRPASAPMVPSSDGATRTVFLVEDDDQVRRLADRALSQSGYEVLSAGSGAEAIERLAAHRGSVDLLVTDIVMPGMTGTEVAAEFRRRVPGVPILYMSGYATEIVARTGVNAEGVSFLEKPFTPSALRAAASAALGAAGGNRRM